MYIPEHGYIKRYIYIRNKRLVGQLTNACIKTSTLYTCADFTFPLLYMFSN